MLTLPLIHRFLLGEQTSMADFVRSKIYPGRKKYSSRNRSKVYEINTPIMPKNLINIQRKAR